VKADGLDLPARILGVSDIYDALSSDRPYRAGMDEAAITTILERERGTKLCPVALDALNDVRAELARETVRNSTDTASNDEPRELNPDANHFSPRIV
jgi:HD-GYP domain-containing protein (c-di-GMP phosphodiesterase class II)